MQSFLKITSLLVLVLSVSIDGVDYPDYPEGYYPFQSSARDKPPKFRKPPYIQSDIICEGVLETEEEMAESLNNLCGDLNDGTLPRNPLGQQIQGHSYPFDLIKEKTLDFFSNTLPVLKEDPTLPKVAKYKSPPVPLKERIRLQRRRTRSVDEGMDETESNSVKEEPSSIEEGRGFTSTGRAARSFCDKNWGLLCLLYNTMSGRKGHNNAVATNRNDMSVNDVLNSLDEDGLAPLTPCPSAVEYVTPVFARNYQGVWRYVVQIPYEGYFTQTVEVTQCLGTKCHYLVGSCLASPRWVSLLVAEIYYPDAHFPTTPRRPNFSRAAVSSNSRPSRQSRARQFVKRQHQRTRQNLGQQIDRQGLDVASHNKTTRHDFVNSSEQPKNRQGLRQTSVPQGQVQSRPGLSRNPQTDQDGVDYCDGRDTIGCFQVRLYYDWFLIPGSCKCWKQDYFSQFAYK